MFQHPISGAEASTVSAASALSVQPPNVRPQYDTVRHMLFGSPAAVRNTIKLLYKLNYAEPTAWSKPIPTGQPNEVVSVLTKKVMV